MSALKEKWQFAKDMFKSSFDSTDYNSLLANLEFVTVTNQGLKLIIATPTQYHKDKIEAFSEKLLKCIRQVYPTIEVVEIEVDRSLLDESYSSFQKSQANNTRDTKDTRGAKDLEDGGVVPLIKANQENTRDGLNSFIKIEKKVIKDQYLNNLNSKFTFDNYLVCSYNEFLNSVAQEVVLNPGTAYNPMFVYSPVGLGKTHISQAIGQAVLENNPSWRVKYIPAETFKQQFVQAVSQNKKQAFIDSFLEIDLLIMDDIQSLSNAEGTQAVFFQVYNQMYQNNKQIVITSDKAPMNLNGFTDRLISRFNSGIVLDVPTPSFEDRISLIKFKLSKYEIKVKNSLVTDIADSIDYSVREIESVVETIKAKTRLNPGKELSITDLNYLTKREDDLYLDTPTSAKKLAALENPTYRNSFAKRDTTRYTEKALEVVKDEERPLSLVIKNNANSKALSSIASDNAQEIIEKVCDFCEVSIADILGPSRQKHIARARQFCMWILKKETNLTLQNIGAIIGNRGHATVIHAIRKVEIDFIKKNSEFRQWAQMI